MVGVKHKMKIKDVEPLTEGSWVAWSCDIKFSFLEADLAQILMAATH